MGKLLTILFLCPLVSCQVDRTTAEAGQPAPEGNRAAVLADGGGMTLYETAMDDGGAPALQIDYNSDFEAVLHDSGNYPLTIVTQDADGSELQRRVLADLDEALEDNAVLAATSRSWLIRDQNSEPEAVSRLVEIYTEAIDDPNTPEDDRPFLIAQIRGLKDS